MWKPLFLSVLHLALALTVFSQSASFSSDSPRCAGDTVHFFSSPPGGTILQETWSFGDGSSQTFLPPSVFPVNTGHLYNNFGSYQVERSVVFTTGTSSFSSVIQVIPAPVAAFTNFPATGCTGQAIDFVDLSYNFFNYIAQWKWNFGDGTPPVIINFPYSPNIQHIFSGFGLAYMVTLTVTSSDGCLGSFTKTVNLSPSPVSNFTWFPVYCSSDPVQFIDLSQTNGGGYISAFNWNFNDPASGLNNSTSQQNPVHAFSAMGNYNVNLTVVSSSGCQTTVVKSVEVPEIPVIIGPSSVCTGEISTFSTSAGMAFYNWTASGGGTILSGAGTSQVKVQWNSSGAKTVSLNYVNSCPDGQPGEGNLPVTVTNPPPQQSVNIPVLSVSAGLDTCIKAAGWIIAGGSPQNFFVLPGGKINMVAGEGVSMLPGITVNPGGFFHARIAKGCDYCTGYKLTENTDDLYSSINQNDNIIVYPNPTEDNITVGFNDRKTGKSWRVDGYNSTGNQIYGSSNLNEFSVRISLRNQPAGIYLFRVTENTGSRLFKIIKN